MPRKARGAVSGKRCLKDVFLLVGGLRLAASGQHFCVGTDVLLIQALDHARIHLAGEAEPGGCFPGPLPRRHERRRRAQHA